MNKTDPPTTFGVFKPVGHTLMAFYTEDQLQSAVVALTALGFAPASMVHYSAGRDGHPGRRPVAGRKSPGLLWL